MSEQNIDMPKLSFEEMGLSKTLLEAVNELGWDEPTLVQMQSFPLITEGRDIIVQSRTGTGKTGAFALPLLDHVVEEKDGVQALILAPTRELALQSADQMEKLGTGKSVRAVAVYGGSSMDKQIKALARGAQIVSGTPGRVLDHLHRGTLDVSALRALVLDEADEMLSMGFAKELNAIIEQLPKKRQTLLFSATVDGAVKRMASRHMQEPEYLLLSGDQVGALGVTHYAYMVHGVGRARDLCTILAEEKPESAIIFCNTKADTEEVNSALTREGFNSAFLNGDLPQKERERVMKKTRSGEVQFLVATDVAARGIDVSHLTHVVNYKLPEHLEQYVHRTGRTGRAGKTGTALALIGPAELGTLYYLRLQYGIELIERSLPSNLETKTSNEAQELSRLEGILRKIPEAQHLDLARRLLTHPRSEGLVAALIGYAIKTQPGNDE